MVMALAAVVRGGAVGVPVVRGGAIRVWAVIVLAMHVRAMRVGSTVRMALVLRLPAMGMPVVRVPMALRMPRGITQAGEAGRGRNHGLMKSASHYRNMRVSATRHPCATPTSRMERSTRQRSAIRAAIEQARRPLSPQEVLAASQAQVAGLGLATVYRNLKLLVEAGEIQQVTLPGDSARYEPAHQGHHHHFQCTRCQRVFDVHHCPGDLGRMAPPGFRVERHELTLYGDCADCIASLAAVPAAAAASALPGGPAVGRR